MHIASGKFSHTLTATVPQIQSESISQPPSLLTYAVVCRFSSPYTFLRPGTVLYLARWKEMPALLVMMAACGRTGNDNVSISVARVAHHPLKRTTASPVLDCTDDNASSAGCSVYQILIEYLSELMFMLQSSQWLVYPPSSRSRFHQL
jgi:hypothetical protein